MTIEQLLNVEELQLKEANAFWAYERLRTLRIACEIGVEIEIEEHDDSFLYDLFDQGEADLTDDDIAEAIMEYAHEF